MRPDPGTPTDQGSDRRTEPVRGWKGKSRSRRRRRRRTENPRDSTLLTRTYPRRCTAPMVATRSRFSRDGGVGESELNPEDKRLGDLGRVSSDTGPSRSGPSLHWRRRETRRIVDVPGPTELHSDGSPLLSLIPPVLPSRYLQCPALRPGGGPRVKRPTGTFSLSTPDVFFVGIVDH